MKVTELDKHYAIKLKGLRKQHKINQDSLYSYFNLTSQQQYSDLEKEILIAIKNPPLNQLKVE